MSKGKNEPPSTPCSRRSRSRVLLSKRQRRAIGMLFVDEAFTDAQLAREFGISAATVRSYGAKVLRRCVIRMGDHVPGAVSWKGFKKLLSMISATTANIQELKFSTFYSLLKEAVARNAVVVDISSGIA